LEATVISEGEEAELLGPGPAKAGGDPVLSRLLLDHIEHQIRSTDTKAGFIATANAFLVNSLAALVTAPFAGGPAGSPAHLTGAIGTLVTLLTVVAFLALIGSTLLALLVIRPRLNPPERGSLLFFESIGAMKEDEFISEFRRQEPEETHNSVLAEVHAKSKIACDKYAEIKWSINCLFAGLILWALVVVVRVSLA
jgi:hypothetical protein